MEMGGHMPAEVPPHWLAYVEVADTDRTAEEATSRGGSVVVPGTDFPGGRFAIITDPQGATLGVMTTAS
ncbi:Glyoxalase-like domain protein [compost metagenome]